MANARKEKKTIVVRHEVTSVFELKAYDLDTGEEVIIPELDHWDSQIFELRMRELANVGVLIGNFVARVNNVNCAIHFRKVKR